MIDNFKQQTLSEIIPEGIFVGTSLILRQGDRYYRQPGRMYRWLLENGAELIGGDYETLPGSYCVRLTDSQEAIALALGEDTRLFYNSLG